MLTDQRWLATIGVKLGRGGWQINGQRVIYASTYSIAYEQALYHCDRGEQLLTLEEIRHP